jgi:uncharacterized coiled-coil protein SlyX
MPKKKTLECFNNFTTENRMTIMKIQNWPIVALISCMFIFATASHANDERDLSEHLFDLRNSDVRWTKTADGPVPTLRGEIENILQSVQHDQKVMEKMQVKLRSMLDKHDRYIAAHVLLTFASGAAYSVTPSTWNSLEINFDRNGNMLEIKNQSKKIATKWNI